jgi:MinD-like ATPase involved in chromosome partitioning or flagellar assembly
VSNVPSKPQITAIVRADGSGEVSVDGERSDVHANGVAGARAAVIARVAEEATARDRPVRVATTDLDGVYALIVHPDGTVESEGPIDDDEERDEEGGSEPFETNAPRDSALIPPPPFGIDDLIDFTETEVKPVRTSNKHFEPAPTRRSTFRAYSDGPIVDTADDPGYGQEDALPAREVIFPALPDVPAAEADAETETETDVDADAGVGTETVAASDGTPAASVSAVEPVHVPAVDVSSRPASAPSSTATAEAAPTLEDFLESRPSAPEGPAKQGWQGFVRRITGGVISPAPSKAEQSHRDAIRRVQRSLRGPRTIVVLNPKGGAHKTTATLLLAATFGIHRGGSTLAWDNNETRGTLGWRAQPSRHSNTAVNLLRDLGRFSDVETARVGYLDNYVRGQGDAQFDVLASDEDAAASSTIDASAFDSLHSTLSRFYRLLVIDTGNNMRASNWEAAVEAADQLVVVTTVNEETAASAAWLIDGLRQKGHQDKVSQAVTILSAPGDAVQPELSQRLHAHFSALTRVVLEVPYDPGFQSGGPLNVEVLSPQTREAWLQVTAAVADGL